MYLQYCNSRTVVISLSLFPSPSLIYLFCGNHCDNSSFCKNFFFFLFSNAKLINYEKLVNLGTKNCTNGVPCGSLLMHWSCVTKRSVIFNCGNCIWNQMMKHSIWMWRARSLNTGGHQRCRKEAADKGAHPWHVLPGLTCLSQRVRMNDWKFVRSQVTIPQPCLETKAVLLLVQMYLASSYW